MSTITSELPKDTPFEAGVRLFSEKKAEGDRDLVNDVRGIFQEAGVADADLAATYDQNRHIQSAVGKPSPVQRVQINRFIEIALKRSTEDTIAIREEILPAGPLEHWLEQYRSKIAPFIASRKILA